MLERLEASSIAAELVSDDLVLDDGVSLDLLDSLSEQVEDLDDSTNGLAEASLFFRDDTVLGAGTVLELDELAEDGLDGLEDVGDSLQTHGLDACEVVERQDVQVGEGGDDARKCSFDSCNVELRDLGLGDLEQLGGELVEGWDEHAWQDDVQRSELRSNRLRGRLRQILGGGQGDERHKECDGESSHWIIYL